MKSYFILFLFLFASLFVYCNHPIFPPLTIQITLICLAANKGYLVSIQH